MSLSLKRISNNIERAKGRFSEQREFASSLEVQRKSSIDNWYKYGGKVFLDWVKQYYRTYQGSELTWEDPYLEEYYLAIGHPWFVQVFIMKAGQMGYSESLIAVTAFCLAYLHIPIGFGFEERGKAMDMVGSRVQPALDHIKPIQELTEKKRETSGREDIDNKSSITVAGIKASFFYGKVAGKKLNSHERQAPSSLSSFTAFFMLADEIELWARGMLSVSRQRMRASELLTKPLRGGSTPGAEGGITDTQVKTSKLIFKWLVICSHCQGQQFLDAFGNYLKAVEVIGEDGEVEEAYLDPTGRPLDWFALDKTSLETRFKTAYLGCVHCSGELTREVINGGHYRCEKTGITLREAIAESLEKQEPVSKIAIHLPVLASHVFNPVEKIEDLYDSDNPVDEIQQGLGKPLTLGAGKISLKKILACVDRPVENRKPDLISLGIDQGRHGHYSVIEAWYLSKNDSKERRCAEAQVKLLWYGKIANLSTEIDKLVQRFDVDVIGIDNEPEWTEASNYALLHRPEQNDWLVGGENRSIEKKKGQVFLFDQCALKGSRYKRNIRLVESTREDSGVVVYSLDRTWGLDQVRNRIYRGQYSLPRGMHYDPKDKSQNFISHFLSSDRIDGKWIESAADHFFHATCFAQTAVLVSFFDPGFSNFSFGSIDLG